jgi:hypothetical protein
MPPRCGAHASARKYTGSIRGSTGGEEVSADAVTREWWQRARPRERVVAADGAGHRTLAATVRRQGLLLTRHDEARPEDVRP